MASRDIYSVYMQLILICHEIRQLEPVQYYRTGMKRDDRMSKEIRYLSSRAVTRFRGCARKLFSLPRLLTSCLIMDRWQVTPQFHPVVTAQLIV